MDLEIGVQGFLCVPVDLPLVSFQRVPIDLSSLRFGGICARLTPSQFSPKLACKADAGSRSFGPWFCSNPCRSRNGLYWGLRPCFRADLFSASRPFQTPPELSCNPYVRPHATFYNAKVSNRYLERYELHYLCSATCLYRSIYIYYCDVSAKKNKEKNPRLLVGLWKYGWNKGKSFTQLLVQLLCVAFMICSWFVGLVAWSSLLETTKDEALPSFLSLPKDACTKSNKPRARKLASVIA